MKKEIVDAVRLHNATIHQRNYFYHMGLWEQAEILEATLKYCVIMMHLGSYR